MAQHYGARDPLSGIVSDGLIFYIHPQIKKCWDGNTNSNIIDLVAGQTCTPTAITADDNGYFVFNGTSSMIDTNNTYIDNGTSYTLSSTDDDYTLEAWIYVETSQGDTTSADSIIGNTSTIGTGMQVGAGPFINYAARSQSNFDSTRPLTQGFNSWIHVVFAHQQSSFTTTYINGSQDTTSSSTSYHLSGGPWGNMTIGHSGPRVTGYFDGKMGPIRIYNKGLSAAEVTQNFNASKAKFGV